MTSFLDIRTLSFASALVAVIMFGYLSHLRATRKTYPGFGQWTLSALLGSVGLVLLSLRGLAPDWLSIIMGNVLVTLYAVLVARGLRTFAGLPNIVWPDLAIMSGFTALFYWFTYQEPNVSWRVIISSMSLAYYCGQGAWLPWGPVAARLGERNWSLVISMAFLGLFFVLRVIFTFLHDMHLSDLMAAGPVQAGALVASFLGHILVSAGLVFLNIQRLELDLISAQQELKILGGLLPICANCKRIRDDGGYWHQVEQYISQHSQAEFTHGICPECLKNLYPDVADQVIADLEGEGILGHVQGQRAKS